LRDYPTPQAASRGGPASRRRCRPGV
jgi:hypothetical protein